MRAMPDPLALSIQDLTVWYGECVAVEHLCLEVQRGEILGLLGPNGSGKSTTMAAVAGQGVAMQGTIRVGGVSESACPKSYRSGIGYVPQELAFYEELTARDNLMFFGRLQSIHGRELRNRVADALDFVHLTSQADRKPSSFSGGMQRRLNLACALLHRPQLLLLDEPTVGLDIASRDAIFDVLKRLRQQGVAMILTTHHLDEAQSLCDRIAILNHGQLVAEGTLTELLHNVRQQKGYWIGHNAPTRLEEVLRLTLAPSTVAELPQRGGATTVHAEAA
ncbi:MAG: ABC transporter ATP-binding protein [Planctomycetes bacterium]|jgi:ABC-2 type transport system ATP-binding protein|nr:ABC transporter ATP-binding protein [Planctomycetota bacterium]